MAKAAVGPAQGQNYRVMLNSLDVSVVSGDILAAGTHVVVTGDDPELTGAGGVSQALKAAGGSLYVRARADLLQQETLVCGKVYPTTAGLMAYSHVFHAISMRPRRLDKKWEDLMAGLYQEMVEKTVKCGANSFATPLLGTGHANVPSDEAVRVAIKGLMAASNQQGQTVKVVLFINDPVAKAAAVAELQRQSSHRPLPVSPSSKSGVPNPGSAGHVSSSSHHSLGSTKSPSTKQPASTAGSVKNKNSPGGVSSPPAGGVSPSRHAGGVSPLHSAGSVSPSPSGGVSPSRSMGPSPPASTGTSPGKKRVARSKSAAGKSNQGGSYAGATGLARAVSTRNVSTSSAKTQSPPKPKRDSPPGAPKRPLSSRSSPGGSASQTSSGRQPSASARTRPGSKRKSGESRSRDGGSPVAGGTEAAQLGAGVSPSGNRGQRVTRSTMRKSGDGSDTKTAASHGGARPKVRAPARRSSSSDDDGSNIVGPGVENGEEDAGSVDDVECPICRDDITDPEVLQCGHTFCRACIQQAFVYKPVCPSCGAIHGVITGTQPKGQMSVSAYSSCLPGFEGFETFVIDYSFPSGIQGAEHPHPGSPYEGTYRRAFLPQCPEGELVLRMLRVAFQRRMVFTVGRSTTTGRDNVVTWNDIHHKTSINGGPQRFGYPDPSYLQRIKEELESKGVREEDAVGVSAL